MKFFINGLRTSVIVDDFIPVHEETYLPAFCSSPRQRFWAILIEKAWAKINGSYFKIRKGPQSFLGIHLTGVPAENIEHNIFKYLKNGRWNTDKDAIDQCWERLMSAFERNYTLTGDTRDRIELDSRSGLLPEKDYEIQEILTT